MYYTYIKYVDFIYNIIYKLKFLVSTYLNSTELTL